MEFNNNLDIDNGDFIAIPMRTVVTEDTRSENIMLDRERRERAASFIVMRDNDEEYMAEQ